MHAIQHHRLITVTTPLGADVLLFHRMTGKETLSRLYKYKVDFLCENNNLVFNHILGQNICVNLRLANNQTRHFNGFVSRFSQQGTRGEYYSYCAIVRPWLWFLTRTTNCRIFQEMTVPDIVKQVCNDQGFSDIETHLTGSYRTWVYCVQYRETDFNFVSRLNLFRSELNNEAISDIRLALNQNQPLGNSCFYTKVEAMTGQRREPKPRGRPRKQQDKFSAHDAGQGELPI